MRALSWVQNKFAGKPKERKRSEAGPSSLLSPQRFEANKEEFKDWPEALLSIGTFGKKEMKEEQQMQIPSDNFRSSEEAEDFTVDEVVKLQKELIKLLKHKSKTITYGSESGGERANHPLNRFLNCPSSLEVDRAASLRFSDVMEGGDVADDLSPDSKIILRKARDILANNPKAIKKKSISFLLKKMFVCSTGFSPGPSLRNQMPESRLDKLLRTVLHKKMHQEGSEPMSSVKRYLEDKSICKTTGKDESKEMEENACKWVKTDSNFIVLEMRSPAVNSSLVSLQS